MRQSKLLLETLKRTLRHRGITYAELARKLSQSESNIKRIFSQRSISLDGLEDMCQAAGIEIFDLVGMSRREEERAECFSRAQETALAADPKLFAFLYLLIADVRLSQIVTKYQFTSAEGRRYLLQLDKLGVLRLNPGDRFQLLVSRNIKWIADGPLNRLYEQDIKREFLNSDFTKANERIRFLTGRLSKASLRALSQRLDRLIAEFTELAEIDEAIADDDAANLWMIIAYRPWRFSVVRRYRRAK